jgi:hypothetical protein
LSRDALTGADGVILARRFSAYPQNRPPVGLLVFLAITGVSGTS